MTDNDAQKTASAESSTKRAKTMQNDASTNNRPGSLRSGLALILATIALIASGYLWYTALYENRELFETDVVAVLDRLGSDNAQTLETLTNNEQQLKNLQETQNTLRASLEKIDSDFIRNRSGWALAEAEQLLVIANNRLQLARDVRSALLALRAADQQLNHLANPNLLPTRRDLAHEINLLESLDKTDISGITLRLSVLADSIDRLPLAIEIRMKEPTNSPAIDNGDAGHTSGWRQSVRDLWKDLMSLVRIRDNIEIQRPLLPPEQQYFVRENLRLMLYGAQSALLQSNIAIYQQNLKTASRIVKEFFDLNSSLVSAMDNEIAKLQNAKITADLPNISASLTSLRRLTASKASP